MKALAPSSRSRATSARSSRYTKLRPLGKGAFGSVYLVREEATRRQLVLKEISLRGMTRSEQKSTTNEVHVLKRLKHPSIVKYHDAFFSSSDGGCLNIVMEHCAGGDLGSLIDAKKKEGKRFAEADVVRMLAESAHALAYCHHDLHLIHRDLKPQNFFLASDGAIKIGDFGISKALAASQQLAMTQCGTPLYMSPELVAGKCYDRSADVWALGCVLYEVMCLKAPWIDQTNAKGGLPGLMRTISTSTLSGLGGLRSVYSAELCSLLEAMLAKDPKNRPSLARRSFQRKHGRRPLTPVAEAPAARPGAYYTPYTPPPGAARPSIFDKGKQQAEARPPADGVRRPMAPTPANASGPYSGRSRPVTPAGVPSSRPSSAARQQYDPLSGRPIGVPSYAAPTAGSNGRLANQQRQAGLQNARLVRPGNALPPRQMPTNQSKAFVPAGHRPVPGPVHTGPVIAVHRCR